MSGNIELHPTKGVNPRLTYCPRCGGDGRDIILLGRRDYKITCPSCGAVNLGGGSGPRNKCGKCQESLSGVERTPLGEYEKLPSSLCDACEKEVAEHKSIVEAGGVYFKCTDCRASGVIKPDTYLAKAVRESSGIEAPNPVGLEFTKANCPQCGGGHAT